METEKVLLPDRNMELLIRRGDFSENIDAMQEEGQSLITSEELGLLLPWFLQRKNLELWVDLAFVYENDGDADILIAYGNNPVLHQHQRATEVAYKGKAFHLYKETEEALKNAASTDVEEAIKTGVLRVKRKNMPKELPKDTDFLQEPVANFMFRSQTNNLEEVLRKEGLDKIAIITDSEELARNKYGYLKENTPYAHLTAVYRNPNELYIDGSV